MDGPKKSPLHDSSSEDELRPIDLAMEALKKLKLGLSKMEHAVCMYVTETEPQDHHDSRVHPFKQQFLNTYKGR